MITLDEPKLKQIVNIHTNDRQGTIIGIWEDQDGKQYLIQYADDNGVIHEIWMHTNEFTCRDGEEESKPDSE